MNINYQVKIIIIGKNRAISKKNVQISRSGYQKLKIPGTVSQFQAC